MKNFRIPEKKFYFSRFEHRKPYTAISDNKTRTRLFQFAGILTVTSGVYYLNWRWSFSINPEALWFAIPLVIAETLSFVATILFIINFWSNKDFEKTAPVHYLSEIEDLQGRPDRPLIIDLFITTFNEEIELVRQTAIDAKRIIYPFPDVKINIFILDDGKRDGRNPARENMKAVADEEQIGYLIREHNEGYKAGNLKNGLKHTNGDLFVILDADTRAFPEFLVHTTGYFRKSKVAWVQTPQWFYDTTEAKYLSLIIIAWLRSAGFTSGKPGKFLIRMVKFIFGKIKINEDIFGNDPRLFYDVILRRRNYYNAAFCCGAGSIHRREAIMNLAVKEFAGEIKNLEKDLIKLHKGNKEIHDRANSLLLDKDIIPFKFHASEDIYTSLMLHADKENKWESILHPDVECKMLSPQDLDSWIKQRRRYAEGSIDIAVKDNPLFIKGLSLGQKICYFNTIWSYFAPLWVIIFLLGPIVFFFTLSLPVRSMTSDFFLHFLPFLVINNFTMAIGAWGISTKRGNQYYIAGFWYMLQALFAALKREKIKFNVTPKKRKENLENSNYKHIIPHLILISLSLTGIAYNAILLARGKHPAPLGFIVNSFWSFYNIKALSIFIRAAFWKP